jgi:tellurite methyltransferase
VTGAHEFWDRTWRTGAHGDAWSEPDPWVLASIDLIRARHGRRTLDLGCGTGRHALAFARAGFEAHAVDRSLAGLRRLRRLSAEHGLPTHAAVADVTRLPYPDATFDYVLAWNVVYHGDGGAVAAAGAEVTRVLRRGGMYQTTMLSKRHTEFGHGREVAPDTYVQPGGPLDKAHPHYYCDARGALAAHPGLALVAAVDREQSAPGSFHWHLLFETGEDAR